MGIDLKLYPQTCGPTVWSMVHTMLEVERCSDFFVDLQETLRTNRVREPVYRHFDEGVEKVTEDGYGAELTSVLAGELAAAICEWYKRNTHSGMPELTRAAVAWLRAVSPKMEVILYWD